MKPKNPNAVALGKKAAGVPKNFSADELKERTKRLLAGAKKHREKKRKAIRPCPPGRDSMFWRQDEEVAAAGRAKHKKKRKAGK